MMIITPTNIIATHGSMRIEKIGHFAAPRYIIMVVDMNGISHQIGGATNFAQASTMMVGFAHKLLANDHINIDTPNRIDNPSEYDTSQSQLGSVLY